MTTYNRKMKLMEPSFKPWQPGKDRSRQIAVLMSGGVDSSVAAHLLKEQGWDVLGVTMKIPVSCDANVRGCCGADAASVCRELDIPHYLVDVTEDFQEMVVERFRQAYAGGETPNPCVDCNTNLKFSLLWDFLEGEFGIRYLATGHYGRIKACCVPRSAFGVARSSQNAERRTQNVLGRAKDKTKDQSYFIHGIPAGKLARVVLPLGELTKVQVRSIAERLSLTVAEKSESMELCFAGQGDYRAVLTGAEANTDGDITDMRGNRIGTHKGIANYTLGQRKGIGFAGGRPLYVGRINARENTIALGTRDQISFAVIKANRVNTLIPEELAAANRVFGKIRSYGEPAPCKIIDAGDDGMTVEFDEPQFAPCPGQRLVLYNSDDNIIAGGTIFSD